MSGDRAEMLGDRLLKEVVVDNMNEIFKSLRHAQSQNNRTGDINRISTCNPILDALRREDPDTSLATPIFELISPPPAYHPSGAGKTSLLYLSISYAILPLHFSPTIPVFGQDAAVVVFDPLSHFSIPRLVKIMVNLLRSKIQAAGQKDNVETMSRIRDIAQKSIRHVHVYRPHSWTSLLATVRSLPSYLSDGTKHESMHRRIHSIILDDVDAFVWSVRDSAASVVSNTNSISTLTCHLATSLQKLSAHLSCALILTSSSASPTMFRPSLPISWNQGAQVTRLAVHRVPVARFAPNISVERASAERQQRWEVVSKGRFECWNVGASATTDSKRLRFRVGEWGVDVEQDGHEELSCCEKNNEQGRIS